MKNAHSIREAQNHFPELVRRAESGERPTITRNDKTVAYLMGVDEMAALSETTEILANPAARTAIADAEAGRGRIYSVDEILE